MVARSVGIATEMEQECHLECVVLVVEKEQEISPDDMGTITMWAEKSSSEATNARRNAPGINVRNAIRSTEDAAKIRKDGSPEKSCFGSWKHRFLQVTPSLFVYISHIPSKLFRSARLAARYYLEGKNGSCYLCRLKSQRKKKPLREVVPEGDGWGVSIWRPLGETDEKYNFPSLLK